LKKKRTERRTCDGHRGTGDGQKKGTSEQLPVGEGKQKGEKELWFADCRPTSKNQRKGARPNKKDDPRRRERGIMPWVTHIGEKSNEGKKKERRPVGREGIEGSGRQRDQKKSADSKRSGPDQYWHELREKTMRGAEKGLERGSYVSKRKSRGKIKLCPKEPNGTFDY